MAKESFDISTGCDLQEVDNAVNQTRKELGTRFDFRGVKFEIDFKRAEGKIVLSAPDDFKIKALWEVLLAKMTKRGVPVKNLNADDPQTVGGGHLQQVIDLKQGIDSETAKRIVKFIKDLKNKKVQSSIQGEELRVTSASRDELQKLMTLLKEEDWGLELQFGNYRSR